MAVNPVYFGYYSSGGTLVDLTAQTDIQNVNLNRESVYQGWTDGNWLDHRDSIRSRIRGDVTLGWAAESDYRAFLAAFAAATQTDGTVHLRAYVNNVQSVCDFYAFVDSSGAGRWDLANGRQWQTLTLQISER